MRTEPVRGCRPIRIMSVAERKRSQVVILLALAAAWAAPCWLSGQKIPSPPPGLNLILDSVERTEQQNPALTHATPRALSHGRPRSVSEQEPCASAQAMAKPS